MITSQNKLVSVLTKFPNREEVEFLRFPAIANIAMAAQPWARDTITTLIKVILELVIRPTIIKVMCVTLL